MTQNPIQALFERANHAQQPKAEPQSLAGVLDAVARANAKLDNLHAEASVLANKLFGAVAFDGANPHGPEPVAEGVVPALAHEAALTHVLIGRLADELSRLARAVG